MAVPAGPTEQRYTGNGVSTVFAVPFLVIQASDLAVYVNGVRLTSGYTQTGVGNPTSSVTFGVAPVLNASIVFSLEVPFERLNDYQENGDFLSATVNRDFDRIWQALKQLLRFAGRALTLGQFDIDGQGWYRAKGNGIRDLRDPEQDQDAATRGWTSRFVGDLLAAITGPINNALNIFYQAPNGDAHVVQDLSGPDGTKLIGRGTSPGTLEDHLLTLASQTDLTNLQAKVVTHQSTADGAGRQVPDTNHFIRYDLDSTKRPKPPGFSWLPFDILGMQANGRVAVSKTALQIMNSIATLPIGTSEGYVDVLGGNNANTGTLVQPWQTLTYAVTQAQYITRLSTGTHSPPLSLDRTGITGNRVRRIIGSGDPLAMKDIDETNVTAFRIPGDDLTTKTWTLNASAPILAQCTITAGLTVQAVLMTRYRDEFGRPRPMPLRSSAAEVASLGGWYFAAGVLYVRLSLNAQFDTTIKPFLKAVYTRDDSTGYMRLNGAEAYFENCAFIGFAPFIDNAGGFPSKAVFKNCSFWYSRVSALLNLGSQIYLDNCEIYRCRQDGLNSHANNGLECVHVSINTHARYCGDFDTLNTAIQSNENGFSMHENGNAAILGGTIYKSSGPGLIDTGPGTADGNGVSLWYGVHSEDSLGVDPVNYDTYGVRKVWIEGCSERGDAGAPVKAQNVGTVLRYGPNAVRGYTPTGGGETVAFDPLNPV